YTVGPPGSYTTLGTATAGSFTADGTIQITIDKSLVGNPNVGDVLSAIVGRTEQQAGVLLETLDSTANGDSFTVHSCSADTPNARDDLAGTDPNEDVVIDVLANDDDPHGETLTVTGITQPTSGLSENLGAGFVRYTPNTDFEGTDSFHYTISNPEG